MTVPRQAIERVFREESGRILARLIRVLGDFDQAEDALQDALAAALQHWPGEGVPDNPGAWITTGAQGKAFDVLRPRKTRGEEGLPDPEDEGAPHAAGSVKSSQSEEEAIA